tara:strand:+ start:7695 stop:9971 length:2277 start_codon:yes stop_codon:yes gene_type:complete
MDELFKEISDSRRIRSQGNTTYLKDGRLFANEKILRGYEDFEKLKTMGSMAIEGLKNTPDFLFGVTKGILPGMAIGAEETFKTFLPFVNNNVMPWLNENVPGYNSMNEYLNDAFAPEGTAQEIGSSLGEVGGQVVAPGGVYSKVAKMALKPMGYGKNFLANVLGYGTAEFAGMPPEEEGLMEMGIQFFVQNEELKNAMLQSIAADEDASYFLQKIQKAPQRYFEGGLLGEAAEQGFRSLGVLYNAVKGSPAVKTTLETIGTKAQESLDAGDGTTLSSMGAGEIDKAINTQLAKLAPNKNVDNLNFYSNALEQAKLIKQEKGTGEQFMNMLLKAGVKKDEIEWTGLDELFKKDKVTKQEVIEQLENNRIALQENVRDVSEENLNMNWNDDPVVQIHRTVMKPEDAYGPNYIEERAKELLDDADKEFPNDPPGSLNKYRNKADIEYYDNPIRIYQDSNTGYVITGNDDVGYSIFKNIEDTKGEGAFKKALNYGTPDYDPRQIGEATPNINYNLEEAKVSALRYAEDNDDIQFSSETTKFENETLPGGKNYREFILVLADENNSAKLADVNFDRSHWEESDVLAHIRTKDRRADDGGKVLYIEEIQSDWGQQGKDLGFDTRPGFALKSDVPSAPFVTDTRKWTALALKRILARAVDEGYDYVSITPGQVHASRWNREGNKEYYDVIIPSVAKDVLKSTYKGAIDTELIIESLQGEVERGFTIKITPEVKEKVSAGQAMFAVPLAVGGMSALNQGDQDGDTS